MRWVILILVIIGSCMEFRLGCNCLAYDGAYFLVSF